METFMYGRLLGGQRGLLQGEVMMASGRRMSGRTMAHMIHGGSVIFCCFDIRAFIASICDLWLLTKWLMIDRARVLCWLRQVLKGYRRTVPLKRTAVILLPCVYKSSYYSVCHCLHRPPRLAILKWRREATRLTGDRAESKGASSSRPDLPGSVFPCCLPRTTECHSNEKRSFRISRHFLGVRKGAGLTGDRADSKRARPDRLDLPVLVLLLIVTRDRVP